MRRQCLEKDEGIAHLRLLTKHKRRCEVRLERVSILDAIFNAFADKVWQDTLHSSHDYCRVDG